MTTRIYSRMRLRFNLSREVENILNRWESRNLSRGEQVTMAEELLRRAQKKDR